MLKFFRRIRQKLLTEGQLRKYLIYAIGEILLVMIGILLALQVNNWNGVKKDRQLERTFLEGLRNNFVQDSINLSNLVGRYQNRLTKYKLVDPSFNLGPEIKIPLKDSTIIYPLLFSRPPSFRISNGTFKSLIIGGQIQLIRNKQLFEKIQRIHEFRMEAIISLYETVKEVEGQIKWRRVHEINKIEQKEDITDPTILYEWKYLHQTLQSYGFNLLLLQRDIHEVLAHIHKELKKN